MSKSLFNRFTSGGKGCCASKSLLNLQGGATTTTNNELLQTLVQQIQQPADNTGGGDTVIIDIDNLPDPFVVNNLTVQNQALINQAIINQISTSGGLITIAQNCISGSGDIIIKPMGDVIIESDLIINGEMTTICSEKLIIKDNAPTIGTCEDENGLIVEDDQDRGFEIIYPARDTMGDLFCQTGFFGYDKDRTADPLEGRWVFWKRAIEDPDCSNRFSRTGAELNEMDIDVIYTTCISNPDYIIGTEVSPRTDLKLTALGEISLISSTLSATATDVNFDVALSEIHEIGSSLITGQYLVDGHTDEPNTADKKSKIHLANTNSIPGVDPGLYLYHQNKIDIFACGPVGDPAAPLDGDINIEAADKISITPGSSSNVEIFGPLLACDTDNDVAANKFLFGSTIQQLTSTPADIPAGAGGVIFFNGAEVQGVTDPPDAKDVLFYTGSGIEWGPVGGTGGLLADDLQTTYDLSGATDADIIVNATIGDISIRDTLAPGDRIDGVIFEVTDNVGGLTPNLISVSSDSVAGYPITMGSALADIQLDIFGVIVNPDAAQFTGTASLNPVALPNLQGEGAIWVEDTTIDCPSRLKFTDYNANLTTNTDFDVVLDSAHQLISNKLFDDNYLYVNSTQTSTVGQDAGLIAIYAAASGPVSGTLTGNFDGTTDEVDTVGAIGLSSGDFILITDATCPENNGLFCVDSYVGTTIGIDTAPSAPFENAFKTDFLDTTSATGTVTKVCVGMIQIDPDGIWQIGSGCDKGSFSFPLQIGATGGKDVVIDGILSVTEAICDPYAIIMCGTSGPSGPTGAAFLDEQGEGMLWIEDLGPDCPSRLKFTDYDDNSGILNGDPSAATSREVLLDDAHQLVSNKLFNDNYLYLNMEYGETGGVAGGIVVNYAADTPLTTDTVDTQLGFPGFFTSTVVTSSSAVFAAGDIVLITDANCQSNNGLYEVSSHVAFGGGGVLTINTTPTESFLKSTFERDSIVAGEVTKVCVSVMRADSDGDWETAKGCAAPLTYTPVVETNIAAYSLLSTQIVVSNSDPLNPTTIAYFAWDDSRYGAAASNYSNGVLIYNVALSPLAVATDDLRIVVHNVSTATDIGGPVTVSPPGTFNLTLSPLPVADDVLEVRVNRAGATGPGHPRIQSINLEFDF